MRLLRLLALTTLLFSSPTWPTEPPRWYVVLFTVDGCHFCEMMREKVFKPMIATGELPANQFYEINMTDKAAWFYFDPMDTYLQKLDLYKRYNLGLFPTTVLLDNQARMIVKLVGITTPEKFVQHLNSAISKTQAQSPVP